MVPGNRRKAAHGSSRGVVLLVLTRFFGKKAVVVARWKTVTVDKIVVSYLWWCKFQEIITRLLVFEIIEKVLAGNYTDFY